MTFVPPKNCALSAHLGYLFTEVPLAARFGLARAAGFTAVEHPAPFEIPAKRLRELLDENGLVLCQVTSGLGRSGEKGIAAVSGRENEFRDGYARALDYAEEAGATFVHAMAGVPKNAERGPLADATYRKNIETALRLCENRRPKVLIEMISKTSVPGYHMSSFESLFLVADEMQGVATLVDTYHIAAAGLDPIATFHAAQKSLGHIHLADHPGRHEPGTGDLDFALILQALYDINYRGTIGFEYNPSGASHLAWFDSFLSDPNLARMRTPTVESMT